MLSVVAIIITSVYGKNSFIMRNENRRNFIFFLIQNLSIFLLCALVKWFKFFEWSHSQKRFTGCSESKLGQHLRAYIYGIVYKLQFQFHLVLSATDKLSVAQKISCISNLVIDIDKLCLSWNFPIVSFNLISRSLWVSLIRFCFNWRKSSAKSEYSYRKSVTLLTTQFWWVQWNNFTMLKDKLTYIS